MKLLVTSPLFPPARLGGGPIRSIDAMLSTAPERHDVKVLAHNYDLGQREQLVPPGNRWEPYKSARVMYLNRDLGSWVKGLRTALAVEPDAYYLNGLFNLRFSIAMQTVTQLSPNSFLSIAPRGELNEGALSFKSRKKSVFMNSVRASRILNKVIWHASSTLEAHDIWRAFGEDSRVIIRENDNLLPQEASKPKDRQPGPLRAVFMSRLSPKKGLDVALEALGHVKHPMTFDVIGPEEDEKYVAECRYKAELTPSNINVRFLGAVEPENIRETLAHYDVMIFPTAGENFGHVIAEALSSSLPVMLTAATPWSPRVVDGGGVLLKSLNARHWGLAIDDYASCDTETWMARRREAGNVYNAWKAETVAPHFFDQLEAAIHS